METKTMVDVTDLLSLTKDTFGGQTMGIRKMRRLADEISAALKCKCELLLTCADGRDYLVFDIEN